MSGTSAKAPWHLWLVAVIAILFNAIGVFDFVMYRLKGRAYLAGAGMTPDQIVYYQGMPAWVTIVWAVGVFAALLASILLLLRNRHAFPVFALSLAAFLINLLHSYVLTDGGAIMGRQMAITNGIIAGLLLLFSWYARAMAARHVLR
ncbi:hypothetical protein SAMN05444678_103278 [Sphingomonas sp. YR710]|uniref:hypothetical protein n=1 Tax=Sphingomonas sp. YR710 TaxID=1882773 RepID=UPI0008814C8D|nr:hypothetical protein [Sphingomonas sp. YR710]SDC52856.1 hypothetical protein SAMN05444678_103278 [Sphingomonas sp. YR710]